MKRHVIILEPDGTWKMCQVDIDQVLVVQGDGRTILDFPYIKRPEDARYIKRPEDARD